MNIIKLAVEEYVVDVVGRGLVDSSWQPYFLMGQQ